MESKGYLTMYTNANSHDDAALSELSCAEDCKNGCIDVEEKKIVIGTFRFKM